MRLRDRWAVADRILLRANCRENSTDERPTFRKSRRMDLGGPHGRVDDDQLGRRAYVHELPEDACHAEGPNGPPAEPELIAVAYPWFDLADPEARRLPCRIGRLAEIPHRHDLPTPERAIAGQQEPEASIVPQRRVEASGTVLDAVARDQPCGIRLRADPFPDPVFGQLRDRPSRGSSQDVAQNLRFCRRVLEARALFGILRVE
jgi:hypothetical protein